MNMRSLFNRCIAFATLSLPVGLHGEQPRDKKLSSVIVEFRNGTVIEKEILVPCPPWVGGKCGCSVNNYVSSETIRITFKTENTPYGAPILTSGAVHIMCSKSTGEMIAPTIGMLEGVYGKASVLKATYTDGTRATKEDLQPISSTPWRVQSSDRPASSFNLKDNERRIVEAALKTSNGNTEQAAKKLGISERSLRRKIKDDKLEPVSQ